ncbi:UNVERIFIED_CONTAM: hypothetical protein GTU68_014222, partial [Idotea baltica]|nr:hypothetical protein [Idotea baltica]
NDAYAIAKLAGWKLCDSYNRQYGTEYTTLIPANLYGIHDNFHSDNSHVIPGLLRRFHEAKMNKLPEVEVWGAGTSRREFLSSDDLAGAISFLLNREPIAGAYNVGSGVEVSIRELAETTCDVVGYGGRIVFDSTKPEGVPVRCLDSSKINSLGWSASNELRDGLERVYDWFIRQDNFRGQ